MIFGDSYSEGSPSQARGKPAASPRQPEPVVSASLLCTSSTRIFRGKTQGFAIRLSTWNLPKTNFVRDFLQKLNVPTSKTSISCETSSLFHMLSSHFRRQLHKRDFQRAFRTRHPHFLTCCLVIFGDSYTNEIPSEHFVRDILTFSHVVLSFSATVTQTRFPASISCETSSLFHILSCHFRRQLHKRDFQRAFRARHPHFFTCCLVIFDDSYTNEISNEHFVRDILTFSHVVLSFSATVTQTRFPASISCETSSLFHILSCHFRRQLHKRDFQRAFRARHPHFFSYCALSFSTTVTLTPGYPYFWLPLLLATLTLRYPYSCLLLFLS